MEVFPDFATFGRAGMRRREQRRGYEREGTWRRRRLEESSNRRGEYRTGERREYQGAHDRGMSAEGDEGMCSDVEQSYP
eukprot:470358-Hanusia_phi.AAC.2